MYYSFICFCICICVDFLTWNFILAGKDVGQPLAVGRRQDIAIWDQNDISAPRENFNGKCVNASPIHLVIGRKSGRKNKNWKIKAKKHSFFYKCASDISFQRVWNRILERNPERGSLSCDLQKNAKSLILWSENKCKTSFTCFLTLLSFYFLLGSKLWFTHETKLFTYL